MRPAEAAAAARDAGPRSGGGGARPNFVAFLADEASETAVLGALGQMVEGLQIRRGDIRTATKAQEREAIPRVLMVNIAEIENPIEALDELAGTCSPEARILVVGEREDYAFHNEL